MMPPRYFIHLSLAPPMMTGTFCEDVLFVLTMWSFFFRACLLQVRTSSGREDGVREERRGKGGEGEEEEGEQPKD